MNVQFVNLPKRIAVLDDDRICPVCTMLDIDGDETEDWEDCVSFVVDASPVGFITEACSDFDLTAEAQ